MKSQHDEKNVFSEELQGILNDLKDSYNLNISAVASDEDLNNYHYNENYDEYGLNTK